MITQLPVAITHAASDQCQVDVHLDKLKKLKGKSWHDNHSRFDELTLNLGAVLSFLLRMTQRTPLKVTRMKWWPRSRIVRTERMHNQNLGRRSTCCAISTDQNYKSVELDDVHEEEFECKP